MKLIKRSGATSQPKETKHHSGNDGKINGELAELAFVLRAASLRLAVSKPYGDSQPYDFIVDSGPRILRVQVKSTFVEQKCGFTVGASHHRPGGGIVAYSSSEADFVAAFVAPHNAWYLIPVYALCSRKFIRLYPAGVGRSHGGRFEVYREAWHLLGAEGESRGGIRVSGDDPILTEVEGGLGRKP